MTKRRQSLTGPSTPDTDTLKKLNHITAKRRKKKKPETSMNLWIILVLFVTWISISVVIADPGWFVHDSPLVGEENNDIFSSEHLMTVKPRSNTKPKSATSVNAPKDLHKNDKPKKVEIKPPSKPVRKPDTSDVVSENFIPVHGTGRKPLMVPEKQEEIIKPPVKENKSEKEPLTSSKKSDTVWFVQDVSLSGENDDDLFSSEQLLVVKPKTKPKPKSTTPVKVSKDRHANEKSTTKVMGNKPKTSKPVKANTEGLESENFIPVNGPGRKPLAAVQNVDSVATPVKRNEAEKKPSAPIENEELPCDNEKDIDCLMETEDLILVNKKKTAKPHPKSDTKPLIKRENVEVMKQEEKKVEPVKKVEEVQKAALHRRLLDNGKASTVPSKPVQQPLIYEIEEETEIGQEQDEDDILATEQDVDEQILRRLRRQATNDDVGSGDRTGGFEETQAPNPAPDYTMQFSTTLNKTETEATLTEEKKANYSDEIEKKLKAMFSRNPGFKDVVVKNVRLDANGRVTADWDLILSLSGATGADQESKKQGLLGFLTETVVPEVNKLKVFGVGVYESLDKTIINSAAQDMFEDACKSDNPCNNGFVCVNRGTTSLCRHKCYHTGLIDKCQNGASCQLDQNYGPYCQCGNGFTGNLCQTQAAAAESDYSTPQLVGAGVAGAVAVTGAVCGAIYCALFRKKKEEDMEYSYFGDDDSSAPAFSDASSNLGVSNYYIDRPSFSPTPMDIYHQNGAFA